MLEFIKEAEPMLRFLFDPTISDAGFNIVAIGVWFVFAVVFFGIIKEMTK